MYTRQLTPSVQVKITYEFTARKISATLDGITKSYGVARQIAQGFLYSGKVYKTLSDIFNSGLTDKILSDAHHYETLNLGDRQIDKATDKDLEVFRRCYGVPEPGIYTMDNGAKIELVSVSKSGNNVFYRHCPRPGITVGAGVKMMTITRWYAIAGSESDETKRQKHSPQKYQVGDVIAVHNFILGVTEDSYVLGSINSEYGYISRTQELARYARKKANRRGAMPANLAGVVGVVHKATVHNSESYRYWNKEGRVSF